MTAFARRHPSINFIFFVVVLLLTMMTEHPAIALLSLLIAVSFALCCVGGKRLLRQLRLIVPLMLLAAILNPLTSKLGETVLFRFPWGSVCTLEAVLYGVFAAIRLAAVLFWFVCWNSVITSDKFLYLFGGAFPSLSLTLCMGLRFVPRLLRRMREVSQTQKCLQPDKRGLRHAGRVVSVTVTWAFESAMDTANSMKSRGYGLRGRTAYSPYRFAAQDAVALAWIVLLGAAALTGRFSGWYAFEFYPTLNGEHGICTVISAACFGVLAAYPLISEGKEALSWRVLR
ncbi:MAG: energy-coupling factor transporter transmembrane protein EcfT [Oscillospiraceae bacterium]|nr:energy-coupling factor transporter transmembrane protein EcfT [Oscillospiraceae bacterium]